MAFFKRLLKQSGQSDSPDPATPAPPLTEAPDAGAPSGDGTRRRRRSRRRRRAGAADGGAGPSGRADAPAPAAADRAGDRAARSAGGRERDRSDGGRRGRRRRGRGGSDGEERAASGKRPSATARALASGGYKLPPLSTVDQIDPADYPSAFAELGLSDRGLAIVAALGFDEPTPIQAQSVPLLLDGRDVVGKAQTGTGKTVAFGFPIVERLDPSLPEVQAIVLVPTRELAQQVFGVLGFLAEAMGLGACALMGGRRLADDFANLEARPQIVVGTPGRVIDHLQRRTLTLNHIRIAVLDEADRMLDIGFEPDIRRILGRSPDDRQTALFSATIPTAIKTLIWRYMRDPETVEIEPEQATAHEIRQVYLEVAERDKTQALLALMPRLTGRTLIFCNMKVTVDRLVRRLQQREITAEAIHGDLPQRKRDRVMEDFRSGRLQILIATNVASRGLDIPDVHHVINYDLPDNVEEYIHRVGRTGRAGAEGSAISFVAEWDLDTFAAIQKVVGDDLVRDDLDLYAVAD